MRKYVTLLTTMCCLLFVFGLHTKAATYGDYEYTVVNGTVTINKYTGSADELTIPSIIDGKKVTAIGANKDADGNIHGAFAYCGDNLISITIPNSVTTIKDYAFYGCTSLKSVTIPNSVKTIGQEAFVYCESLTSVTIPSSVTTIKNFAFYGCTSLKSVTIPSSVTTIKEYAFDGCTSLKSVTIPNSVTTIGNDAFNGCTSLTSVTIPNSVKTIGIYAFEGCTSLKSVTIPNSVTTIGEGAFFECTSLTNVTIPNSVTKIGLDVFRDCTSLTSVTIPNSVTSIGLEAFMNCTKLKSITIPKSVTYIDSTAFDDIVGLTIKGYTGSKAEKYAKDNGFKFISLNPTTTVKPATTATKPASSTNDIKLEDIAYSFSNYTGKLSLDDCKRVYGDSLTARLVQFESDGAASKGGLCEGVAQTALLLYSKYAGIKPKDFKATAKKNRDLNKSDYSKVYKMSLNSFIKTMYVTQSSYILTKERSDNLNKLKALCLEAEKLKTTKKPFIILVGNAEKGGHSLVAYKYEKFSGYAFIHVYDCIYPKPKEDKKIVIWFNKQGVPSKWEYNTVFKTGSNLKESWSISYYSPGLIESIWNDISKGKTVKGKLQTMFTNSEALEFYSRGASDEHKLYYRIIYGGVQSFTKAKAYVSSWFSSATNSNNKSKNLIFLPKGEYKVKNIDKKNKSFSITVLDEQQGATITSTSSDVTFQVNDSKKINHIEIATKKTDTFSVQMESLSHGKKSIISITGKGNGKVLKIDNSKGKLKLSNCDTKTTKIKINKKSANVKNYIVSTSRVKVGSTQTVAGNKYVITSSKTATFKKPISKKITTIRIPKKIKIDGKEYKVTAIGNKAFYGCKKLRKVTIKKTIKKIGKRAFYKCKRLKTIRIYSKKLTKRTVLKGAFKGINKRAIFYVPKGKKAAYKKIFRKRGATKKMKFKSN